MSCSAASIRRRCSAAAWRCIRVARKAVIDELAQKLGVDRTKAAAGVIEIINVNMMGAVRVISVEQGEDPRDFTLVAFGGAGPLHAADVARSMGMRNVLVPPRPGLLSAVGLLHADVRGDFSLTRLVRAEPDEGASTQASTSSQTRRAMAQGRRRSARRVSVVRRPALSRPELRAFARAEGRQARREITCAPARAFSRASPRLLWLRDARPAGRGRQSAAGGLDRTADADARKTQGVTRDRKGCGHREAPGLVSGDGIRRHTGLRPRPAACEWPLYRPGDHRTDGYHDRRAAARGGAQRQAVICISRSSRSPRKRR